MAFDEETIANDKCDFTQYTFNKFTRGVTRVQEMLKNNGNPPAEFDVNTITAFRVNVHATKESDLGINPKSDTSQTDKTIDAKIIEFCNVPRSLAEIMSYFGYKDSGKIQKLIY